MKHLVIFATALLASLFTACQPENPQPSDKEIKEIKLGQTDAAVVAASNQLGFEMMKKLTPNSGNHNNMLLSPLSISYALGMTYNGAEADTKTEIAECMNLDNLPISEVNGSFQYVTEALANADNKVTMEIANSIWYRQTFQVLESFKQVNREYYKAAVTPLDFSNPNAKNIINNWVADATHDKIDKIVENIDPLDVMFLINAIYFKGQWTYQFEEEKTSDKPFYLRSGEQIKVPTMEVENNFRYFHNNYCSAVELPYGRGNFTMVLMLPNEDKHPEDVINYLAEEGNLFSEELAQADTSHNLHVYLPKFTFSYKKRLNETLQSLGMEKAFNPEESNFSKINSEREDLHVSRVKHKSFIEVNEEGTEAAAVTSVVAGVTSVGPSGSVIRFNRPFVFAIREQSTGTILFSGIVENPRSNE